MEVQSLTFYEVQCYNTYRVVVLNYYYLYYLFILSIIFISHNNRCISNETGNSQLY